jgi:hypothetical protein
MIMMTTKTPSDATPVTAVVVARAGSQLLLSPFFRRCDGILLIDTGSGTTDFRNRDRTADRWAYDLLLETKPQRLICGFIDPADKKNLQDAGIDVRLGSCTHSIDFLLADFCRLPKA